MTDEIRLADPGHDTTGNYEYWRQHGGEWGEEYRSRKTHLVYYHIQELMFADYFTNSAPASVLEFGCGTGRHLRYLREIPGIDVFGHDQSHSMVSNILDWADPAWMEDHVTVGDPVGRLPFPDDQFDIVFTSEVLVHVRPEHLDAILAELIRVSRWQILHMEPGPSTELVSDEHGGCWYHDLGSAYARLGQSCVELESGFDAQTPYRVILTPDRAPYTWSSSLTAAWRRLRNDVQSGIDELKSDNRDTKEALAREQHELARIRTELDASTDLITSQRIYLGSLERDLISTDAFLETAEGQLVEERRRAESYSSRLYVMESSVGYRVIERLRRSPVARPTARLLRLAQRGGRAVKRGVLSVVRPERRRDGMPVVLRPPVPEGHLRLSTRDEHSEQRVGSDVWLLAVERPEDAEPVDLEAVVGGEGLEFREVESTPSGSAMVITESDSYADIPVRVGDELVLMRHPWSGIAQLEWQGAKVEINLHGPEGRVRCVVGESDVASDVATDREARGHSTYHFWSPSDLRKEERAWLEEYQKDPQPLSIGHPEWRGIRSSAAQLFDQLLFIKDELDLSSAEHHARLLAEAGCPAVVIQGFPQTYERLVVWLNKLAPSIPVYVIWHGNFLQAREDYAWGSFQTIERLARDGLVRKVGFVKKGMAEVLRAKGLNTGFIMNLVRRIPYGPSKPLAGGPHLGIWNIADRWHRPPFAMIAATSMVEGAVLHISGVSPRVHETLDFWHIERRIHTSAIGQEDMPSMLSGMHLNMNVTLSECAPMLPLESLSVGVPCLLGPVSHYFDDHDYLRSRLVVPSPDTASTIAEHANRAIEERAAIVEAYRVYAPGYNQRAFDSVEAFLELPVRRST